MNPEHEKITGGCLCGEIRYEVAEKPYWEGYCHCNMCKRAYGAPFGTFSNFRKRTFRLTRGTPRLYRSSPSVERGFCGTCGTPLLMQIRKGTAEWEVETSLAGEDGKGLRRGECIALTIGSLDHPENVEPISHGYPHRELPWLNMKDGLPRETSGFGSAEPED